jgi:hypothetical protein
MAVPCARPWFALLYFYIFVGKDELGWLPLSKSCGMLIGIDMVLGFMLGVLCCIVAARCSFSGAYQSCLIGIDYY